MKMKFQNYIDGMMLAHHPNYSPVYVDTEKGYKRCLEYSHEFKEPTSIYITCGKYFSQVSNVSSIQWHYDNDRPSLQFITFYNENDEFIQEMDVSRTINYLFYDKANNRYSLFMWTMFKDYEDNGCFPKLQIEYDGQSLVHENTAADAVSIILYPSQNMAPVPLLTIPTSDDVAIRMSEIYASRFAGSTRLTDKGIEPGTVVVLDTSYDMYRSCPAPYMVSKVGDINDPTITLTAMWKNDRFEGRVPYPIFIQHYLGILPHDTIFIGSEFVSCMVGESRTMMQIMSNDIKDAVNLSARVLYNPELHSRDGIGIVSATVKEIVKIFNCNPEGYMVFMESNVIAVDTKYYLEDKWMHDPFYSFGKEE